MSNLIEYTLACIFILNTFEMSVSEKLARASDLNQPFNPISYSGISLEN